MTCFMAGFYISVLPQKFVVNVLLITLWDKCLCTLYHYWRNLPSSKISISLDYCNWNFRSILISLYTKSTYSASIVYNGEVSFIFQLFWFLEFRMRALLLHHLLHKAFVCSLWKPALFIQQGQNAGRTSLIKKKTVLINIAAKISHFRRKGTNTIFMCS